jgi:hypothetical protein
MSAGQVHQASQTDQFSVDHGIENLHVLAHPCEQFLERFVDVIAA